MNISLSFTLATAFSDKTKATRIRGRQWENTKHKPKHHSDLLAGGQCDQCAGLLVGYSCSLALRRWRRLISPSSAENDKLPCTFRHLPLNFLQHQLLRVVLEPQAFWILHLTAFVAISDFLVIRWLTVYTQRKRKNKTLLTWLTPVTNIVADTFIKVIDEKTKPRKCRYHSQGF